MTVRRIPLRLPALLLALLAAGAPARADDPTPPPPGGGEAPADTPGEAPDEGAGEVCAEAMARRVQSRYEAVQDLSADFVQSSRMASLGPGPGGEAETTRGRVVFAKPGRMRWHYREPEESLVVSDGEQLWTWDPELREAQHLPVGQGYLSGAAIQFLMGEGELLETFRVRAEGCGEPRVRLRLVPREPASYERLGLVVERETGQVVSTEVVDLFGNATEVTFSDLRTNAEPPDETFRFEPPEDAQVIEIAPAR